MVKAEETRAKVMQTIIHTKNKSAYTGRELSLPSLVMRNSSQPGLSLDTTREEGIKLNKTIDRVVQLSKQGYDKKKKILEKKQADLETEIKELLDNLQQVDKQNDLIKK